MKRNLKLLIIIIILGIVAFLMYSFAFSPKKYPKNIKPTDYNGIMEYISDIYGVTFLIPEFENINDANEHWLWENVNQYVWNHEDEYKEKNSQEYGYSYDDISKIVKKLYGSDLKKVFPKGAIAMRYDSYTDSYGPTSFGISNYYDYKIDSIIKDGTTYTVSIYDYTVSSETFSENDETDDYFEIFNNYDYLLNSDNGTPIIKVKTLDDEEFQNLITKKNMLSHKVLTIEYDEASNLYYIKSCKYEETKPEETLASFYYEMQSTFEIKSIDYNYEDLYTSEEVIVNNFDELTSIYTDNAIATYKNEMELFVYKDNGDVYITAGDITVGEYLSKIEFKDIEETENKITCNVVRTFRNSFDPSDKEYNETYVKENKFTIVKQNEKWLIDEFSYNK